MTEASALDLVTDDPLLEQLLKALLQAVATYSLRRGDCKFCDQRIQRPCSPWLSVCVLMKVNNVKCATAPSLVRAFQPCFLRPAPLRDGGCLLARSAGSAHETVMSPSVG